MVFDFTLCLFLVIFFFFFQAEDGIRDGTVTGVQTCALPIYYRMAGARRRDDDVPPLRRLSSLRFAPPRSTMGLVVHGRLTKQKQYSSNPPEPSPGARKCSLSTIRRTARRRTARRSDR